MWMFRWLVFRVMFGAGLIKLRGDLCWRDLTCLVYHYETQPIPNPISYYLHNMPEWFHKMGVLWNHFIEVIVPFFVFTTRRVRHVAALLLISFQIILIISGNLSWLNWLTMAVTIPCLDDQFFKRFFPASVWQRIQNYQGQGYSKLRLGIFGMLVVVISYLSIDPTSNLFSSTQRMNSSFDRLHIVNTYGAFGHIGKKRYEVIVMGTLDLVISNETVWKEYEFKCKPGDVNRRPCVIAPYQPRIDWQIWFAAMQNYQRNPWLIHWIYKLLNNDEGAVSLIESNPFSEKPPHYIKADLYLYEFTDWDDDSGAWWQRKYVRPYFPAVSKDNESVIKFMKSRGWNP